MHCISDSLPSLFLLGEALADSLVDEFASSLAAALQQNHILGRAVFCKEIGMTQAAFHYLKQLFGHTVKARTAFAG